jgi:hypothetical protein
MSREEIKPALQITTEGGRGAREMGKKKVTSGERRENQTRRCQVPDSKLRSLRDPRIGVEDEGERGEGVWGEGDGLVEGAEALVPGFDGVRAGGEIGD